MCLNYYIYLDLVLIGANINLKIKLERIILNNITTNDAFNIIMHKKRASID